MFTFLGGDVASGEGDDDDDDDDGDGDGPVEVTDLGEFTMGLGRWTDRGLFDGLDKGAGGTKFGRRSGDAGA